MSTWLFARVRRVLRTSACGCRCFTCWNWNAHCSTCSMADPTLVI